MPHLHSHHSQQPKHKQSKPSAQQKTSASSTPNTTPTTSRGEQFFCLICTEPSVLYSIGTCDHRETCAFCSLRLRVLYGDFNCSLCKILQPVVIFSSKPKSFEEYHLPSLIYEPSLKIYFDNKEQHKEIMANFELCCKYCKELFPSLENYQRHLKSQHCLYFCEVCLKDRKVFLPKQKLYSSHDLYLHRTYGDEGAFDGEPIRPHPSCKFCESSFFGEDQLYDHLTKNHETCFLCERRGLRYQYFKNYSTLENHFRTNHHLCLEPECLEKKFVVFDSEIDLKGHQVNVHFKERKMSQSEKRIAQTLHFDFEFRRPTEIDVFVLRDYERAEPSRDTYRTGLGSSHGHGHGEEVGANNSYLSPNSVAPAITATPKQRKEKKKITKSDFPKLSASQHQNQNRHSSSSFVMTSYDGGPAPSPAPLPPSPLFSLSSTTTTTSTATTNSPSILNPEFSREELLRQNQALKADMLECLHGDQERYRQFKSLSQDFLRSQLKAEDYYIALVNTFGHLNVERLFDRLVGLLPLLNLRLALQAVHHNNRERALKEKEFPKLPNSTAKNSSLNKKDQFTAKSNTSSSTNNRSTRDEWPPHGPGRPPAAAKVAIPKAAASKIATGTQSVLPQHRPAQPLPTAQTQPSQSASSRVSSNLMWKANNKTKHGRNPNSLLSEDDFPQLSTSTGQSRLTSTNTTTSNSINKMYQQPSVLGNYSTNKIQGGKRATSMGMSSLTAKPLAPIGEDDDSPSLELPSIELDLGAIPLRHDSRSKKKKGVTVLKIGQLS
eukprot:TRINITY_DN10300_c0_g1_i1.p1 TRINITY_DN10300_c0_g1~~TRINITY_DN10300_c0_g1_i1.p1  ORF type:complete len:794 (+),score=132.35 TRINITY_DN10300_c0_g1_i1:57-2384(+)